MSTSSTMSQPSGCNRNNRDAVEIAWSCLAVIFACAWKAVHPDVPHKHLKGLKWQHARRRLYMTLWTILVPEMVVWRAANQWFKARRMSEAYKERHMQHMEVNESDTPALPMYRKCVRYPCASELGLNGSRIHRLHSELVSHSDVPKASASVSTVSP